MANLVYMCKPAFIGRLTFFNLILSIAFLSCQSSGQDQKKEAVSDVAPMDAKIEVIHHPEDSSVEITISGEPFTAYIYPKTIKKPVLFPVYTARGTLVTRGYPFIPVAGERIDHPHHVGIWFNYGNVNGLDFWNNSEAISPEKREQYGVIVHRKVLETKSGNQEGALKVAADWMAPEGTQLLEEVTTFRFSTVDQTRIVDRTTTLTALQQEVHFEDNKEGLLGMRVTRALEHPAQKPQIFTDASGKASDEPVMDNKGVQGEYISSEGVKGEDVWATRAEWVNLASRIGDEEISIIMMDHPDNVGYPTYWHARGYGLFAANPLGQKVFSEGKEELNFSLKPQESVTFRYRIMVYSGVNPISQERIQESYQNFTKPA